MSRLSFSKEPVLWIGAVIIVLQTILADWNGEETFKSALLAGLTAGLTYFARNFVSPVANKEEGDNVE